MKSTQAISALSALAQETRLGVFRLLVQRLPDQVTAGDIALKFDVPPSTMSSHLAILTRAGLTRSERQGRTIFYSADLDGIKGLLEFLVKDCCKGKPADCNKLLEAVLPSCCP